MSIRFTCPCGAAFNVAVEKAGHRGGCPRCGIKFMIPSQGAPEGEHPSIAEVCQPGSTEETPLAASEPSDDERDYLAMLGFLYGRNAGKLA